MTPRWAIIEDGVVTNVIVWDGTTPIGVGNAIAIPEGSPVGPGWELSGDEEWVAPEFFEETGPALDPISAVPAVGAVSTPPLALGADADLTVTLDREMPNANYTVSIILSNGLLGKATVTTVGKTTTTVTVNLKATLLLSAGGSITVLAFPTG